MVEQSNMMDSWRGKRVVVLGGWGFLGSWVVDILGGLGAQPIRVSRRMGCDLTERHSAYYFLTGIRPDIVVNCAAERSEVAAPGDILDINAQICLNSLWASRVAGVRKYINVTASCVYPAGVPLRGDNVFSGPPHGSVMEFAMAKRISVAQVQAYRKQHGIDAITLIFPNLYGPRDCFRPPRAHTLATLLRQFYEAKENSEERVTVAGTGASVQEWMYVEDAAVAIAQAGLLYSESDPLNVGIGIGFTTSELAHLIREIVEFPGNIVYDTSKPDGVATRVLNITRARKLGWKSRTTLSAGIKETSRWFSENYQLLQQAGLL